MTKEQALADCRGFDIDSGVLSLWVFKKKQSGGYAVNSIDITENLENELKTIIRAVLQGRTEVEDYCLVAQNNEVSCLHVGTDETSFGDLKSLVDAPAEEHRIKGGRAFQGIDGYLVRLRIGTRVIYFVRRVTDAWKTRKSKQLINVVMRANRLELVEDRSFTIAKSFDFFVIDNEVFIINKSSFERLMNYRVEYLNSFSSLQSDAAFSGCFVNIQPVIDYVGTNVMQLRRMAVIQQRANYANRGYMDRLREANNEEGWQIEFDPDGKIVATADTMKVIMQVLLNHRLYSKLSLSTYDVQASSAVQ
ncbi:MULTISPECIES: Kiwa anti-phage protein KwaB-like domain-containing protein [Alcaligenes]|jgi:hypothetical protein|uniref:Kiwa anti-phage protein KwaB-like domain-containing protein n=1 Tax=Alcaligenes TaxID=507 RepID=UPI0037531DC7